MLYKGQQLSELTAEQMDEAEACAIEGMLNAQTQYAINKAFMEELGEEHVRRVEAARKLN